MIDLSCLVIQISNKCLYLKIFDQRGNPNLITKIPLSLIIMESWELEINSRHLNKGIHYMNYEQGPTAPH